MAFTLDGYTIVERMCSTPHSEVFAATRNRDGLAVVLKHYQSLDRSERAARRARSEYALLQRIDADGVVRGLALEPYGERLVLVVERFPGIPISRFIESAVFDSATFLIVAERITASLAQLHSARVIHKDIKLSNILINPETLETCIIDLGIAAEIGDARHAEPGRPAEGTLQYIAPEQTGRIGLGIDFRTDLYSLGATFYCMLTRERLFDTNDALELIHSHIAAIPTPPCERAPEVPPVLSRIVMKLLEKDPEGRYQTAWGLHADLRALRELYEQERELPKDFELGSQDGCDRPRFGHTLYGREREIEVLRTALGAVANGSSEVIVISGPAGIGKSSLADALRREIVDFGGYVAQAQFDLDRGQQPYVGFAAAFASLVDQLLAESGERLEIWRDKLRRGVGRIGRALIDLAPSIDYLVEDFPEIPRLAPKEAQDRLALAVRRFIGVFVEPGRPLVMFFDDLQWADPGSRFLLEGLVAPHETPGLLIVGTQRTPIDDDAGAAGSWIERWKSVSRSTRTLSLEPLSIEDTTHMLADILQREPAETEWLADCIGLKTQHNPLLIRRLLEHLWERGLIRWVHRTGWTWDRRELAEIEITEDAAELLAMKIDSLEGGPARILRIAGVLGRVFDTELLVGLLGIHRVYLLQMLMVLTDAGLVAPCSEGFRFVHERVREAASKGIPRAEQEQLHYRAACVILEQSSEAELDRRLFEVVEHLNRAVNVLPSEQAMRSVRLNLRAGKLALRSGASATAMQYLAIARELAPESAWSTDRALLIELLHASAEATYQTGSFEFALQLLERIEPHCRGVLDTARVDAKRIDIYSLSRPNDETVTLALECLQRAGMRLPKHPTRLRVWIDRLKTDWYIRGSRMTERFAPARDRNEGLVALALLLNAGASPLAYKSSRLTFVALAFMLRSSSRKGWVSPPHNLLAGYSLARAATRRSPSGIERYRRAALEWLERAPDPLQDVRTRHMVRAWIDPWLGPRRTVIEPLAMVAEELFEAGELVRASNCLNIRACYLALLGEPLPLVRREFEKLSSIANRNFANAYAGQLGSLEALRTGHQLDIPGALRTLEECLQQLPSIFVAEGVRWVGTLCFLGLWRRALQLARSIEPYVLDVIAMCTHTVDFEFYRAMSAAALSRTGSTRCFDPHYRQLARSRRWLDHWARFNPDFVHMVLGVDAERLRIGGRRQRAASMYERAIERAERQGYIHHAALFRERRSEILRALQRSVHAERDLRTAASLYAEWGADAKVNLLRQSLR